MSERIDNSKCIFRFSKNNAPVMTAGAGVSIIFDTMDCFSNQLKTADDKLDSIDWEKINPATGPVYIEGAMPGDTLKIVIEDISIKDQGVLATGKDLGLLGDHMDTIQSKIVQIKDSLVIYDDRLSIPINPMIGVIGVAPENEDLNCGTPGNHGGNMDNAMITKGSILYLPVFVEGALFALGDLHAVMGDGEIGVTGVEVSGSVTVNFEVIKGLKISNPVLENSEFFITVASSEDLDTAVKATAEDMIALLSKRLPLSLHDIVMMMSITGHTQICQVVDPLKTARFVMPKWVLKRYDFAF